MSARLCEMLQIWGFEGDFILFSDNSAGFALELTPLDISCWDSDRINHLAQRIVRVSQMAFPRASISDLSRISPRATEHVLSAHADIGSNQENVAQSLSKVRIERLENLDAAGFLPRHTLKVFVRRPMGGPLVKTGGILSRTKLFQPVAEQVLALELAGATRLRESLVQGLKALEFVVVPLAADAIVECLYWQWNPTRQIPREGMILMTFEIRSCFPTPISRKPVSRLERCTTGSFH